MFVPTPQAPRRPAGPTRSRALAGRWALCAVTGALTGTLSSGAHAVAVTQSTTQAVSVRACVKGATGPCNTVGPVQDIGYGGQPGGATAAASKRWSVGSGSGSAELSGVIGAPVLKAEARTDAGWRIASTAVALQRYVYTGNTAAERSFGGSLDYQQFIPVTAAPQGSGSGVYAALAVYTAPAATLEVGATAESNFSALWELVGTAAHLGLKLLADAEYTSSASTSPTQPGQATLSAKVTLQPGDSVWVWSTLQAPAHAGGWIDAAHTLVTGWDNPSQLVPASQWVPTDELPVQGAVPEPSQWALMGLALLVAGGLARRAAAPASRPDGAAHL